MDRTQIDSEDLVKKGEANSISVLNGIREVIGSATIARGAKAGISIGDEFKSSFSAIGEKDDNSKASKTDQIACDEIELQRVENRKIAADSFDFIYLISNTDVDEAWPDIASTFSAVRDGGIIAGQIHRNSFSHRIEATVDRFFERFGWRVHHHNSGSWWVKKSALPISYFIPAYNCERWIAQSIRSILSTNYRPEDGDELIVVNDCSTDGTQRMLEEFASQSDRVRVIDHKVNRGGGAARNTAVEESKNPLCFCLDSDNVLASNSVKALRDHLIVNDVDTAAFQEMHYFTSELGMGKPTHIWSFDDSIMDFSAFLQTNRAPSSSGNYLFTKDAWHRAGGYPDAGALDTWGFLLRKMASGSKIKALPESYYFHRYSHESYWVRHAQRGNIDEVAASLLEPYFDRLNPADVRYLQSEKGRKTWFSRLDRRPIRIRDGKSQKFAWLPRLMHRKKRLRCTERRLQRVA